MDKKTQICTFVVAILAISPLATSRQYLWGGNTYVVYLYGQTSQLFNHQRVGGTAGFRDLEGVIGKEVYGETDPDALEAYKGRDYIVVCADKYFEDDFKGTVQLYRVRLDYDKLLDDSGVPCKDLPAGELCNYCLTPTCDPETCHNAIKDNQCRVEGGGGPSNPISIVPRILVPVEPWNNRKYVCRHGRLDFFGEGSFFVDESGITHGYLLKDGGIGVEHWSWDGTYSKNPPGAPTNIMTGSTQNAETFAYDGNNDKWWIGDRGDVNHGGIGTAVYRWDGGRWVLQFYPSAVDELGIQGLAVMPQGSGYIVVSAKTPRSLYVRAIDSSGSASIDEITYTYDVADLRGIDIFDRLCKNLPLGNMGPGPFNHLWASTLSGVGYLELGKGGTCDNGAFERVLEECDLSAGKDCRPVGGVRYICNMIPRYSEGGAQVCTCVPDKCGNGVLDPGEMVDPGLIAHGTPCDFNGDGDTSDGVYDMKDTSQGDADDTKCVCDLASYCGDGNPDPLNSAGVAETCDTGTPPGSVPSQCAVAGEYCDMAGVPDINLNPQSPCQCRAPVCGNGVNEGSENCDISTNLDPVARSDERDVYCSTNVAGTDTCNSACVCVSSASCGNDQVGPGEMCDVGADGMPGDDSACPNLCFPSNDPDVNKRCQCGSYSGRFIPQPPVLDSDTGNFDVLFIDTSDVPSAHGPVSWTFDESSVDGNCILKSYAPPIPITRAIAPNAGITDVADLTLKTTEDDQCLIELTAHVNAARPGDPKALYYVYFMSKLCPSCNVTEMPTILHGLSLYSGDVSSAQSMYIAARDGVNALKAACGATCSAGAKAKLAEAENNRKAAEAFKNVCAPGEKLKCQMAQYYSTIASRLAREGMQLLGL